MRRLMHVRLPAGPRLSTWADLEELVRELRGDVLSPQPRPVAREDVQGLLDRVASAKAAKGHRPVRFGDLKPPPGAAPSAAPPAASVSGNVAGGSVPVSTPAVEEPAGRQPSDEGGVGGAGPYTVIAFPARFAVPAVPVPVSGARGGLPGLLAEVRSARAEVSSRAPAVAEALRVGGSAAANAGVVWDRFVSTLEGRAEALEALAAVVAGRSEAGGSQDRVEGIAQDLTNLWLTYEQASEMLTRLGVRMPGVSVLLGRSVPPVGESVDGSMASRGGLLVEAAGVEAASELAVLRDWMARDAASTAADTVAAQETREFWTQFDSTSGSQPEPGSLTGQASVASTSGSQREPDAWPAGPGGDHCAVRLCTGIAVAGCSSYRR
jgi:hypothetical protein